MTEGVIAGRVPTGLDVEAARMDGSRMRGDPSRSHVDRRGSR